tara:strand:+ start:2614 stop:3942 length:1329 start_codon:yes stop_codon:yes gene_type:complete
MIMIQNVKILFVVAFLFSFSFTQNVIEGRWHLVGYEESIMYQFENNLRYSIYSLDGSFGGLEDAGNTPNPYSINDDVITLDLFFGNIVSYEMNFLCDGFIVEFNHLESGLNHSIMFKEGYDYNNGQCENPIENCCDAMINANEECDGVGCYIPQCADSCEWLPMQCWGSTGYCWCVDDDGFEIPGSSMPSWQGLPACENLEPCNDGYIEINGLCFYENDIDVLQKMIDNSYQSEIDLGCGENELYCGSPNPYMDSPDSWMGISYDNTNYTSGGNGNGIIEPLELGMQEWENGRLVGLMCGAYIYCQLSGNIPDEIENLSSLETFRIEGNYMDGFIPDSICDLNIDFYDRLAFDLRYNRLCAPYPDCVDTDDEFWGQYNEECYDIGDINFDRVINVLDITILVNMIIQQLELGHQEFTISNVNYDNNLDVSDVVQLVNMILNN